MSEAIVVGEVSPELIQQAQNALGLARAYRITCPELREAASDDLKAVKTLFKQLDEQEKSITRPINEGLKRVREMFRRPKEWLEQAEATLKGAMLTYDREIERVRAEERARAARAAEEEKQRLEALAKSEEKQGHVETAATLREVATMTAPPPVAAAPKIAGEAKRETWRAEVYDLRALCAAIATGEADLGYALPNQVGLNAVARTLKDAMNVPGVRAVREDVLAVRSV